MRSTTVPFSAGTLGLYQAGPSRHAADRYDFAKVSVLLPGTTARWRPTDEGAWRSQSAGTAWVAVGGVRPEIDLGGDGQFVAIAIDFDFLGLPADRWADRVNVRDPFLLHLFAEAGGRLRRGDRLPAGYAEGVAVLACAHARDHLARPRSARRSVPPLDPDAVRRVADHVTAALAGGHIPVGELADVAGLSVGQFTRAFASAVGDSPARYVARRRAEWAWDLLVGPRHPSPIDVAARVGFSSQSHLTRGLRQALGTTPAALRRTIVPAGARP